MPLNAKFLFYGGGEGGVICLKSSEKSGKFQRYSVICLSVGVCLSMKTIMSCQFKLNNSFHTDPPIAFSDSEREKYIFSAAITI